MVALQNKVVVITGASSGFGKIIAQKCVQSGASVVLAARSEEPLAHVAATLQGNRILAIPTDVTQDKDVAHLVRRTLERFGSVDVLVNSAGFGVIDSVVNASLSDFNEMLDVNLCGVTRCTQAFLPHMLAQRSGHIIMMASLAGLIATNNMGFYSASKFALIGMSRALMLELHGTGVLCTVVCPGIALTGFQRRAPLERYARSTQLVPWTTAERVADVTLRAVERKIQGEIVIPHVGRVFAVACTLFPGLARRVMSIIG
ncbi:MAG: SDR family NAD(P)-dependent oxidoreductase [Chloroflexota bacterium]